MNLELKISFIKILFLFAVLLLLPGCNSKQTSNKNTAPYVYKPIEQLYGNWLCSDLLDSISKRKNMTSIFDPLTLPYAYEIQFDQSFGDSALIYNGFEQYFLEVAMRGDSVIFYNAVQGNPLVMLYDSVSATLKITIMRHDNYPLPLIFFKAGEKYIQPNGRFAEAFTSAFNEATIAGSYLLMHSNQISNTKITFNLDGTLSGYEGGYRYQCCTGGDCLGMMATPMNTMSIFMKDKPAEDWGWYLSSNSDTLTLVAVKASNPDEPGTFKPTATTLKLLRR